MSDSTRTSLDTPVSSEPVLPTSATWSILGHHSVGSLTLEIAEDGSVSGSVYGDPLRGSWDPSSRTLSFVRDPGGSDEGQDHQYYRGYRFTLPGAGGPVEVLAGCFDAFGGSGASAGANRFGWFALLRGLTTDGPPPGAHLYDTLEAALPTPPTPPTGFDEAMTIVANGYSGPLLLATMPANPPGGPTWGDVFGENAAHVHGFVRVTQVDSGPHHQDLVLLRSPRYAADGLADQVFRGQGVGVDLGGQSIVGWAGSFTALSGTGAPANRPEYGWFAVRLT
jgi:hypothetical protein